MAEPEVTFAKPKRARNLRKRERGAEEAAEEAESAVVRKGKGPEVNPNVHSTTTRKRGIEKVTFEGNRSAVAVGPADARATAYIETETAEDRDATAIQERAKKDAEAAEADAPDKKVYRGMNAYKDYVEHREVLDKKSTSVGPMRAPTNLRVTTFFDYKPDICKDYKETGYCGFGDTCKFMHDRGDYKAGWQIEKEWEEEQKRKKMALACGEEEEEEEEEDFPFACLICRESFVNPVSTRFMS